MAIEPLSWLTAKALIECVCAELAQNANDDPTLPMPSHCCLRAGTEIPFEITVDGLIAVDRCCEGEAYVKINSVYPSLNFPNPDEAPLNTPCQLQRLAVSLEIGTIRCINTDDCDENSEKLRLMTADADAMFRAVCCWAKALKEIPGMGRNPKWFAQGWEQAGPEGGCLSGTMQVFASIPGPGCC
jgi:hypothetical protein